MDFALAQMKCLLVISARVVLIKAVESNSNQISDLTHTLWLNVSQIYDLSLLYETTSKGTCHCLFMHAYYFGDDQ